MLVLLSGKHKRTLPIDCQDRVKWIEFAAMSLFMDQILPQDEYAPVVELNDRIFLQNPSKPLRKSSEQPLTGVERKGYNNSVVKTQDPRPKTQDPRPKTQDPRPKTQDPRPQGV
ncbi:MAG: hypothetical protein LBD69_00420 [Puniceicoccales bacterium]|jgi:hypothetical protein|nr:hypothetical protein [Puniceicoccales bacterium]